MSITNFKPQFDNAYQEIFQKVLVGKEIANTRFEALLSYGASVERVAYDISAVYVRTVSRGNASTIDSITDSNETLTINIEKEAVFYLSDGEVKQAGPLNPGEVFGGQIAIKVAADLDARIFYETLNAAKAFDTGDLTTGTSSGVPIAMSLANTPIMVVRMPAKLRNANITLTNMALVVDSYIASDIEQYLLGKQFSIVESVFMNGYAGPIATAEVYVSQNLTGVAVSTPATTPTNADTFVIGGVTFTLVTGSVGTTPGNVLFSSTADAMTNLAALINAPGTTTSNGVALSAADQATITQTLKLAATAASTKITIVGTGSGRLVITGAANMIGANLVNYLACYYGKKGAIDLVVQDIKEVDMRITTDRRGTNVFSSYLAGIKTFADGAKKFLNVKIAV